MEELSEIWLERWKEVSQMGKLEKGFLSRDQHSLYPNFSSIHTLSQQLWILSIQDPQIF